MIPGTGGADDGTGTKKLRLFKSGLWLCWIAILLTPVGLLAIGGGPCAGPNNTLGSIILFGVGFCALFGALFGVAMVLRNIAAAEGLRDCGVLCLCAAPVLPAWLEFSTCSLALPPPRSF